LAGELAPWNWSFHLPAFIDAVACGVRRAEREEQCERVPAVVTAFPVGVFMTTMLRGATRRNTDVVDEMPLGHSP